MTHAELLAKLEEFRRLPTETEWLEFKEVKSDHDFDFDKIGKYFSALSNEANLKNQPFGWLIFGVKDKPVLDRSLAHIIGRIVPRSTA